MGAVVKTEINNDFELQYPPELLLQMTEFKAFKGNWSDAEMVNHFLDTIPINQDYPLGHWKLGSKEIYGNLRSGNYYHNFMTFAFFVKIITDLSEGISIRRKLFLCSF